MRVVIAGGHGKVAMRLARLLEARGDEVVGLIRNTGHITEVQATGADAVVCDLEQASAGEVADILRAADAVVFAAGAGPGSGAGRKETVDKSAAILVTDAAAQAGVSRVVQVSTMGAGKPPDPERGAVWAAYIAAKTLAEGDLRRRALDWTILRPGRLTDDPGTGLVELAEPRLPAGSVTRDDTAAVLAGLLDAPGASGRTLELVSGSTPVEQAIRALPAER